MPPLTRIALVLLPWALVAALPGPARAAKEPKIPKTQPVWPALVTEIHYPSPADGTEQPAMWYAPSATDAAPVPLLVALHTWSSDYKQPPEPDYAAWCIAKGWVFIHPNFRGPNKTPQACGSDLVVKDILGAVDYARKTARIDPDRIYLIGGSGGGHAALLMAGRAPDVWAAVSAWVPIADLAAWHAESTAGKTTYAAMLEKACGGPPGKSAEIDAEYRRRSGVTHLPAAVHLPLDINTGIHDGHAGSVPVSQSLNAFNAVAAPADRIAADDIRRITEDAAIPAAIKRPIDDPLYRRAPALFRRESGNVRVTIFDGGHAILPEAGLPWLAQQRKGRPAVWRVPAEAAGGADVSAATPEAGK